jgi:transposase-like protein
MGMKVRMQVGRTWLEVDATNVKEAIRELSEYASVFGETTCGLCGSQRIQPSHRTAKGYEFYSWVCADCNAQLSYGQTKEGGRLFAKRRDQNGDEVGKNGWHQYSARQPRGESQQDWGADTSTEF